MHSYLNILSARREVFIMLILLLYLGACQSQPNQGENSGESDSINQTPSLPEAREPMLDTVQLEVKDFVYLPPKVTLPPGREVMFVLTNNGEHNHRIFFKFPYGNAELEEAIPPGGTDSVTIKIPEEEGTYEFYCPEDQHREQAMRGEIIVKAE